MLEMCFYQKSFTTIYSRHNYYKDYSSLFKFYIHFCENIFTDLPIIWTTLQKKNGKSKANKSTTMQQTNDAKVSRAIKLAGKSTETLDNGN